MSALKDCWNFEFILAHFGSISYILKQMTRQSAQALRLSIQSSTHCRNIWNYQIHFPSFWFAKSSLLSSESLSFKSLTRFCLYLASAGKARRFTQDEAIQLEAARQMEQITIPTLTFKEISKNSNHIKFPSFCPVFVPIFQM